MMQRKAIDGILVIIILILCFGWLSTCHRKKSLENIIDDSKAKLDTFRNKQGQQVSQITILEGSISDLKKLNSEKDSTLRKLQKLVDRKTTSATIISNTTTDKGKTKTIVSYDTKTLDNPNDTIQKSPCDTVYPIYTSEWADRWSKGKITATKDSIGRQIVLYNEYAIKETWKRKNIFSEKVPTLEITNLNPSTQNVDVKTFRLNKPKSHRGLIFGVGLGIGAIGAFLLLK